MALFRKQAVRNAVLMGSLCSIAYFAVYIAKNILSAVSPEMIDAGLFSQENIGTLSSSYFLSYAFGQLVNGAIGDKVKPKYMISGGLLFSGIVTTLFAYLAPSSEILAVVIYCSLGIFLSMIYGPMTKVVAENVDPIYAPRCSLGYTFSSFLGSPAAGLLATWMSWQNTFLAGSACLFIMALACIVAFTAMEKIGIVKYNQYKHETTTKGGGVKSLIKHRIIRFTLVAILTGVVRTTVVFWMPTYFSQYLGFSPEASASIFAAATFIISFAAIIAVFSYESIFKRNIDRHMQVMFSISAVLFLLMYFIKIPLVNIVLMIAAIMASNASAAMLWSKYCPSLRDTGMVSSATGFLDFSSYMAASVSSNIFGNAAESLGWGNLILVWTGLMVLGVLTMPLFKKNK